MVTPLSPYAEADVERFLAEPVAAPLADPLADPDAGQTAELLGEARTWARSPFDRDRARIVHSAALRRLAGKTQVVGPSSDDFIRNRLTHTLEVAQVGRGLAVALGCDPDLVEAACLAHDLGHPPFGHNGERALNEAAATIGGFEGNAQTFRLLTRLESKTFAPSGRSLGLNLTRAGLDAATKYPWSLDEAPPTAGRHADGLPRAVRKFGVYDDDREVFDWMRTGAPPARTCLESQLMDFADDVAYSVHDVEDGIVAGRIDLAALSDQGVRAEIWPTVQDWYAPDLSDDALELAYKRLSALAAWPRSSYDGSRVRLAGLKNLTSRLINRFCLGVQQAVAEAEPATAPARYGTAISVPPFVREEIVVLKGIAAHLVMRADDRVSVLAQQREIVSELVDALWRTGPAEFDPTYRADFDAAADDAGRLRAVIDQVASFTDPSAVNRHRALRRGSSRPTSSA